MKRNYISPEISVHTFSDTVQTTEGEPIQNTSAVVQAKQYFELNYKDVREVLIMKK